MGDDGRRARVAPSAVSLAALYSSGFLVLGVSLPFLPLWLGAQGLAASEIGLILALPIVVRVVLTGPLMSLADRGLGARRLLVAANLGLAAAYCGLLLGSGAGPPVIALAVVLAAAAQAPIAPASDLVTLAAIRRDPRLDYGRIRLWGSVAFLAANVGAGYAVERAGTAFVVPILIAFALAGSAVSAGTVPPGSGPGRSERARDAARPRLPGALVALLLAGAAVQASHAALYGFGSLIWRGQGFSASAIGWLWAIGVLAEIALFAVLGRTVGPGRAAAPLVMLGAGAAVVRYAGLAMEPGFLGTSLLQALHGLTFGATHLGTMAALARFAPEGARGRAQGLLAAATSLASAAGTIVSGWVYPSFGALTFASMIPLAAAGLVIAAVVAGRSASQPHSAGEGG